MIDEWQFIVSLVIGLLSIPALIISIKALRSSKNTEELIGDEISVDVSFGRVVGNMFTTCRLDAPLFPVADVVFQVGISNEIIPDLKPGSSRELTLPLIPEGTRWKLRYTDPATKRKRRQCGVVRYRS